MPNAAPEKAPYRDAAAAAEAVAGARPRAQRPLEADAGTDDGLAAAVADAGVRAVARGGVVVAPRVRTLSII